MEHQLARGTGVFSGDKCDFAEDAEGAQSDVFEVADGCRDDVESAQLSRPVLASYVEMFILMLY